MLIYGKLYYCNSKSHTFKLVSFAIMPQAISTCLLTGIKNPSVVSSMMVCPIFNEFTYAPPVSFSINYENSFMYYILYTYMAIK